MNKIYDNQEAFYQRKQTQIYKRIWRFRIQAVKYWQEFLNISFLFQEQLIVNI